MKILLTGASGFVGQAVLKTAQKSELQIRPVFRSMESAKGQLDAVTLSTIDGTTDWAKALQGVEVVIHAAARVEIVREEDIDPHAEYRRVNLELTLNLARQAAAVGVRRFIFISSIKVNGETTMPNSKFTAEDTPSPEDDYGLTKAEAEVHLKQLAQETGMEVTIIRPPLIYGLGVKGNFASLISCVRSGFPLPLRGLHYNRRSLVGIDNLVDLILVCADHPKAANQTFLVSDGEDLSTTDLLTKIGKAIGQPARLLWVPPSVISFMAGMLGKRVISRRLMGSLQVDISKTNELLDWKPSVTVDEGLRRAVERE